jgi:hypothetical protein
MELENESQSELVPTVAPVLLDLSTMGDSEQLDQKISALVSDFAKAEGDGLTVVLPYIKEMQQVLSQRSERNKSDAEEADDVLIYSSDGPLWPASTKVAAA